MYTIYNYKLINYNVLCKHKVYLIVFLGTGESWLIHRTSWPSMLKTEMACIRNGKLKAETEIEIEIEIEVELKLK